MKIDLQSGDYMLAGDIDLDGLRRAQVACAAKDARRPRHFAPRQVEAYVLWARRDIVMMARKTSTTRPHLRRDAPPVAQAERAEITSASRAASSTGCRV